jgi:hypothetical protein
MDAVERMALTVFCGLLCTPYGFIEDMMAYEIAVTMLAERRKWRLDLLDVLFWLWPMLSPAIYIWKGWLLTPFVLVLAVGRVWIRRRDLPSFQPVLRRAAQE